MRSQLRPTALGWLGGDMTLLVIGAAIATGALTSYALVGTVWLVGYPFLSWRFPRRTAAVVAIILALISLVRELPGLVDAANTPVPEQGALDLAGVFRSATQLELSEQGIVQRVRALKIADWPSTARTMILETFSLKSERYMDLHQSSLRGEVVRTTPALARSNSDFAAVIEASDDSWVPLLKAAASGSNVVLEDGYTVPADGLYYLSLMHAWGRWAVLSAIERVHNVQTPLTQADRELGPVLGWIYKYVEASSRGDGFLLVNLAMFDASNAFDTTAPLSTSVRESVEYLARALGPDVSSLLDFLRQQEVVEIDTLLAIAEEADGSGEPIDWADLNHRRRLLGLPIVDINNDLDLDLWAWTSPWGQILVTSNSRQAAIEGLRAARLEVNERFVTLMGFTADYGGR